MACTSVESEDTLKHNWKKLATDNQKIFATFFGHCEYHDVPQPILRGKLESCYLMTGNKRKAEEYSKAVEKRILENQPARPFYQLKPIFVNVATPDFRSSGIYVIFRVKRADSGKPIYIDEIRTYADWEDFLRNNTLPEFYLLFPESGNYTPETDCKFIIARSASKTVQTVMKAVATTATIVSSVALAVATPVLPILAPVTLPLIGTAAAGAAYVAADGVVQVVDLVKHDENMSPTNPRALDAYLDITFAGGGLLASGAATVALLSEEATLVIDALKIASSAVQGVSIVTKLLVPLFADISLEDFKNFCLCCLNVMVDTVITHASTFVSLFMAGYAACSGNIIPMLRLSGFKEVAFFLFKSLLPVVLNFLGPKLEELSMYFTNLLCNKLSPHLPDFIDTDRFHMLKRDFFSIMEKASLFFNVPDVLDIKFNNFSFFMTFSLSTLRLVWGVLEKHLHCKKSGNQHDLTQSELVKLWFNFMDLIRCCSPRNLICGTKFLLKKISRRREIEYSPPSTVMLKHYAKSFLEEQHSSTAVNEDEPLYPTFDGMQVHEFYAPNVGGDMRVLSDELKDFLREKAEILLREEVSEENSNFDESGNGYNSLLHLSPSPRHKWRKIVFNRTVLENGKAMVFVTLLE